MGILGDIGIRTQWDIGGQNPIKSASLSIFFFRFVVFAYRSGAVAVSIPAPIRERPHGGIQRNSLAVVTQRIYLSPRINHPFFDRPDVITRTVKDALDFGVVLRVISIAQCSLLDQISSKSIAVPALLR